MNYAIPSTGEQDWLYLLNRIMNESGEPDYDKYIQEIYNEPLGWAKVQEMNEQPEIGYGMYSTLRGMNKGTGYRGWLGKQYEKYYNQFNTLAQGDPTKWWTEYMSKINPWVDYVFSAPYSRGEQGSSFYAPSLRMVR